MTCIYDPLKLISHNHVTARYKFFHHKLPTIPGMAVLQYDCAPAILGSLFFVCFSSWIVLHSAHATYTHDPQKPIVHNHVTPRYTHFHYKLPTLPGMAVLLYDCAPTIFVFSFLCVYYHELYSILPIRPTYMTLNCWFFMFIFILTVAYHTSDGSAAVRLCSNYIWLFVFCVLSSWIVLPSAHLTCIYDP